MDIRNTKESAIKYLLEIAKTIEQLPDKTTPAAMEVDVEGINQLFLAYRKLKGVASGLMLKYVDMYGNAFSPTEWKLEFPNNRILTAIEIRTINEDFQNKRATALPEYAAIQGIETAADTLYRSMIKLMPSYVWLPIEGVDGVAAIGLSTGTRNGGSVYLRFLRTGETPYELTHITSYP